MTKQCFLHMGYPKTATTALQHYLHSNHEFLLRQHGLLYPPFAQNHTNPLLTMFLEDPRKNITNRRNGVVDRDDAEALRAAMFETMTTLIDSADCSRVFLSAEGVKTLKIAAMTRLRDWLSQHFDSISVAIVLRDPIEWSRSVIQHSLLSGSTIEESTRKPKTPRYAQVVGRAWQVFGKENVHLFKFERNDTADGGVLRQILGWAGLDPEVISGMLSSDAPKNASISQFSALVLDSLNRQRPLFTDGRISSDRRQYDILPIRRISGEERFGLTEEQETILREVTAPEFEWLRENTPFDWPTPASKARDDRVVYDQSTIDSLALLISDLINARSEA